MFDRRVKDSPWHTIKTRTSWWRIWIFDVIKTIKIGNGLDTIHRYRWLKIIFRLISIDCSSLRLDDCIRGREAGGASPVRHDSILWWLNWFDRRERLAVERRLNENRNICVDHLNERCWEDFFDKFASTNEDIGDVRFSKKVFREIFDYDSLRFTIFFMKTKTNQDAISDWSVKTTNLLRKSSRTSVCNSSLFVYTPVRTSTKNRIPISRWSGLGFYASE